MRPDPIQFDRLTFEVDSGDLYVDGVWKWQLNRTPGMLLAAFMKARGGFLSTETQYNAMYWRRGEAKEPDPSTVDSHVTRLRQIIRPFGYALVTSRGRGHRLTRIATDAKRPD